MIGLFIVGMFITSIVGAACYLVVTGIRADKRDLDSRPPEQATDIGS